MSWLRFGGAVAAVALAMSVGVACGGAAASGSSSTDGSTLDATVDVVDGDDGGGSPAKPDAANDAQSPTGACRGLAAADAGDSGACEVNGPSALSCSGEVRFRYYCGSTMPPPMVPPITGCFFSTWAFGMFDCPAAAVRDANNDDRCVGRRAFSFPSTDGATSAVAVPASCDPLVHLPNTTPAALFACCD